MMLSIFIWLIIIIAIVSINKSAKGKTKRANSSSAPVRPPQNTDVNRRQSTPRPNVSEKRTQNEAQPNIVERAKANSRRYAGKDVTLEQMESEHQHSERVGSAVASYVEKEREEHRRMHEEPIPHVEEMSLLGSVEDLMVKGYDGNLSFERDFLGEATDMLARFTLS